MAILNKEMKPGVKCFVEGFVVAGGDRFYVQSNGIIAEDPDDTDVAVDVYIEKGQNGKPEMVTAQIENCYWVNQKTEMSITLPKRR